MNDYEKGWQDRLEVEKAWRTYHKGIMEKGMIIGLGFMSAFAGGGMLAGAIATIAMDWSLAIPIALLGLMLLAPLLLGPAQLDQREKDLKEREEARQILAKHRIKGFV